MQAIGCRAHGGGLLARPGNAVVHHKAVQRPVRPTARRHTVQAAAQGGQPQPNPSRRAALLKNTLGLLAAAGMVGDAQVGPGGARQPLPLRRRLLPPAALPHDSLIQPLKGATACAVSLQAAAAVEAATAAAADAAAAGDACTTPAGLALPLLGGAALGAAASAAALSGSSKQAQEQAEQALASAQAAAQEQGQEAQRRMDQLAADMAALQQQLSRQAQVGGAGCGWWSVNSSRSRPGAASKLGVALHSR